MATLLRIRDELCESVLIPAGPFLFGEDLHLRYLPPFEIDRFPVTVGRYAEWVRASGRRPPVSWTGGTPPALRLDHPVTGVTFRDALAFARDHGRAIPTEEQWEKAARGTDGRAYPWGDRFNVRSLNSRAARRRGTTSVDRYPGGASPYGVMDMAGNVWEWTDSWFDAAEDLKVLRGGCCNLTKEHALVTSRHFNDPRLANDLTGFRTVLNL